MGLNWSAKWKKYKNLKYLSKNIHPEKSGNEKFEDKLKKIHVGLQSIKTLLEENKLFSGPIIKA